MERTLEIRNELEKRGVLSRYAIGGAMDIILQRHDLSAKWELSSPTPG